VNPIPGAPRRPREDATVSSQLTGSTVREWLSAVGRAKVPVGLSVQDSLRRAEAIWNQLISGGAWDGATRAFDVTPDVFHGLARVVEIERGDAPNDRLTAVSTIYEQAKGGSQLPDDDETHALCARFSYVAWSICREMGGWGPMRHWEEKCATHVLAQEGLQDFLLLPFSERSDALNERFLSDPATILVTCRQFAAMRNKTPREVARDATLAYRWLAAAASRTATDDGCYFAGELARLIGGAVRHLGRLKESEQWADLATSWFTKLTNPAGPLATIALMRAIMIYDRHSPQEALLRIPQLLRDLTSLNLTEEIQRCRLLEAFILKDLGRLDESLDRLRAIRVDDGPIRDPLVLSLVLMNIGEINAKQGALDQALGILAEAMPIVERAATPWALANLQAVMGEVFRDRGKISEAVQAFRAAVDTCSDQGMEFRAAYFKLILGETLLASGLDTEATQEILAALPIFEREAVIPDAVAAIALLRESLRRQKTDPSSIRELRNHLQRIRESGRE
jgi:tetratricopeptide (TPR) repeat protein